MPLSGPACGDWHAVPTPNMIGESPNALAGVAALSASDIWTVGYSSAHTLIAHWNGTAWNIVPSPSPEPEQNILSGVAVVSANDVWAVGTAYTLHHTQALTEQWNGTSWTVVPDPTAGPESSLLDVTHIPGTATTVLAVGSFLHYNAWQALTQYNC